MAELWSHPPVRIGRGRASAAGQRPDEGGLVWGFQERNADDRASYQVWQQDSVAWFTFTHTHTHTDARDSCSLSGIPRSAPETHESLAAEGVFEVRFVDVGAAPR